MAGLIKLSAFAVAASVSASAFGLVTLTETFGDDPTPRGWSGVNNITGIPPFNSDYGFKMSDNTGTAVNPPWGSATAEGEAGGRINRGPNSFYGVDLGGAVDFATNDMSVQGVLNLVNGRGSSTLNVGWSRGITSVNGSGGDPTSALYMSWDDAQVADEIQARSATGGIDVGSPDASLDLPTNTPIPFEMDWDSATGTYTVTMNGNSSSLVLGANKADLDLMTHWGMWSRTDNGADDAAMNFFIDDIQFTAVAAIPEPAALGLLGLGGLLALRRRMA